MRFPTHLPTPAAYVEQVALRLEAQARTVPADDVVWCALLPSMRTISEPYLAAPYFLAAKRAQPKDVFALLPQLPRQQAMEEALLYVTGLRPASPSTPQGLLRAFGDRVMPPTTAWNKTPLTRWSHPRRMLGLAAFFADVSHAAGGLGPYVVKHFNEGGLRGLTEALNPSRIGGHPSRWRRSLLGGETGRPSLADDHNRRLANRLALSFGLPAVVFEAGRARQHEPHHRAIRAAGERWDKEFEPGIPWEEGHVG